MRGGVLAALLVVAAGGWKGFPVRNSDATFARCAFYNRSVEALNRAPFRMLGLLRDREGGVGMSVLFRGGARAGGRLSQR